MMEKHLSRIIKESVREVLLRESQEGMMMVTKECIEDRFSDQWRIVAEEPTRLTLSHIETESEGGALQVIVEVDNIKTRITGVTGQFYDMEDTVLDDIKTLLFRLAELDDSKL